MSGHGALIGSYIEVPCSEWQGTDSSPHFNGACISGETAADWPAVGCGNQGRCFSALHTTLPKLINLLPGTAP